MTDFQRDPELDKLLEWWSTVGHAQFPFGLHLDKDGSISKIRNKSIPLINSSAKIGRNEACPCGSGKKYKKCCL